MLQDVKSQLFKHFFETPPNPIVEYISKASSKDFIIDFLKSSGCEPWIGYINVGDEYCQYYKMYIENSFFW